MLFLKNVYTDDLLGKSRKLRRNQMTKSSLGELGKCILS